MSVLFDQVYCEVKFAAPELRGKPKDEKDNEEDGQNESLYELNSCRLGFMKQYSSFTS